MLGARDFFAADSGWCDTRFSDFVVVHVHKVERLLIMHGPRSAPVFAAVRWATQSCIADLRHDARFQEKARLWGGFVVP